MSDKICRGYEDDGREKRRFKDVKVRDDDRGEGRGGNASEYGPKSVKRDDYEPHDGGKSSEDGGIGYTIVTGQITTYGTSPKSCMAHRQCPGTKVSAISKTPWKVEPPLTTSPPVTVVQEWVESSRRNHHANK